jgi:hypothetical protein
MKCSTDIEPKKGATKCMYMDYNVDRKVFTQWQWRTIQECVNRFFLIKHSIS